MTQLKSLIERIEIFEYQKKEIADDIKSIYGEAKSNGFDTKILKAIIKIRKIDPNERAEFESLLDAYMNALEGGEE